MEWAGVLRLYYFPFRAFLGARQRIQVACVGFWVWSWVQAGDGMISDSNQITLEIRKK